MELDIEDWKSKYREYEEIEGTEEEDDEDEDEGYSAMSMLMAAADILVENCLYESKADLYRSMLELEEPTPPSPSE
ncbi:MAG: hypothetical protein U9Q62_12595 [Campylobacterota bacterium]|nr:hypothetical protein [Campylobacterota bacterium]